MGEGRGAAEGFSEQEASDAFSEALVWELLKAPQQPPAQAVEDMEPAGQAATTGDATAVAHACSEQEASLEADYTQPADELDEPEDPGLVPSTGKPADQPLEDPFVDADAS